MFWNPETLLAGPPAAVGVAGDTVAPSPLARPGDEEDPDIAAFWHNGGAGPAPLPNNAAAQRIQARVRGNNARSRLMVRASPSPPPPPRRTRSRRLARQGKPPSSPCAPNWGTRRETTH